MAAVFFQMIVMKMKEIANLKEVMDMANMGIHAFLDGYKFVLKILQQSKMYCI